MVSKTHVERKRDTTASTTAACWLMLARRAPWIKQLCVGSVDLSLETKERSVYIKEGKAHHSLKFNWGHIGMEPQGNTPTFPCLPYTWMTHVSSALRSCYDLRGDIFITAEGIAMECRSHLCGMEVGGGGVSAALFSTLAADRYLLVSFSPLDAYLWALKARTLMVWKTGEKKVACALLMFVLYLEHVGPEFYRRKGP